jgi:predicted metal-dependent phosphoesterase TrpH
MAFCAWQPRNVSRSRDHELVDLHCHSTLSDGTLTVTELIELAVRRKLSALAITDHDNIDAFAAGTPQAQTVGLDLLPGVEISSYDGESDVHILGYFFDPTNLALNQTLERIKRRRMLRAKAMVRKLNKLGMELRLERVMSHVHGGTVGRPHIARALLEEEYVGSFQEAFEKWLSPGKPAYVDSEGLTPTQAVALIRNAGGVAVMAHPHHTNRDELIPKLVDAGLGGIEIYCWKMPQSAGRRYQEIARRFNLVWTGGSDSHGEKPGIPGLGSVRVSRSVVDKLLDARDRHFAEF